MTPERAFQIALDVYDRLTKEEQSNWLHQRNRKEPISITRDTVTIIRGSSSTGYRVNSNRPGGLPMSPQQREQLKQMLQLGYPHRHIAEHIGVSSKTVTRYSVKARVNS